MGKLNRHINGGKVHLKSFPGSKTNQLNHHTIPILEEHQYDAPAIRIGVNDLLKGMPDNVNVDSISNDILKIALCSVITISVRCLFQVLPTVPK